MKAISFILAAVWLGGFTMSARADIAFDKNDVAKPATKPAASATPTAPSDPNASTTATTSDAARIADFQRRFAEGMELEKEGKPNEALALFNGILAEAPDAKGSLQEAGFINFALGNYAKANDYFDRLHALVPEYPKAIEALIQINQELKHDAKVEILIQQLQKLYATGKIPQTPGKERPYFVRERIHLNGGTEIDITQFFDYHQPPYYAWWGEFFDADRTLKRRITVNYDPDTTQSIRAKDPKLAQAEQFLLIDNVLTDGKVTRLDVYQQFLALPEYLKMRTIMMEVFANGLKPIDSAPIPASAP